MDKNVQVGQVLIDHPDITATSILKRRNKGNDDNFIGIKAVNFLKHSDDSSGFRNGDISLADQDVQSCAIHEPAQSPKPCSDRYDNDIATPEQQKIISWRQRKNRSHSMPLNRSIMNNGVFVESSRFFTLRNRHNKKDLSVEVPSFQLR